MLRQDQRRRLQNRAVGTGRRRAQPDTYTAVVNRAAGSTGPPGALRPRGAGLQVEGGGELITVRTAKKHNKGDTEIAKTPSKISSGLNRK